MGVLEAKFLVSGVAVFIVIDDLEKEEKFFKWFDPQLCQLAVRGKSRNGRLRLIVHLSDFLQVGWWKNEGNSGNR